MCGENADLGLAWLAANERETWCRLNDGQRWRERMQIQWWPSMWAENAELGLAWVTANEGGGMLQT